jgi:type I restriction enzyme S subunit
MNDKGIFVGEIFNIERGGSPRPIQHYLTEDTDSVPWIMIGDTTVGGKYIESTRLRIKNEGIRKSREVYPGELLLTNSMSFGRPYILKTYGCIHDGWLALKPKRNDIDLDYAYHALGSAHAMAQFQKQAAGATVKNLNKDIVASIKIPLPPLEEQRRIAAILDKATELEVLSMKQSRLLEDAEKHLFLEYFGSPFPGKTPWPVAQLGELGSLERGISKHRPRNDPTLMDGPYPFIQTGDVAGCRGKITTFSATYSEKGLAQSRLWPAGTLCITIAANIAKTGILDFDACFPDSVVGFQERSPAIITYVQCWMSFLQGHIEQMAPESAQKNINLEILRGLSVPVPSEDRLKKFHVAILSLRCTWTRSTQRRGQTAELKSSLQSVFFAA